MVIDAFINKISDTELLRIWKQVGDHYDWTVKMELASALVKEVQEDWIANHFTDDDIPDNLKPLLLVEAQKNFDKKIKEDIKSDDPLWAEALKYVKEYGKLTHYDLACAYYEGYQSSQNNIPDKEFEAAAILQEALDKLETL